MNYASIPSPQKEMNDNLINKIDELIDSLEKSSKSSSFLSKRAIGIAVISICITAIFSRKDYKGDEDRQTQQSLQSCIMNEYLKLQIDDSFLVQNTEDKNKVMREKRNSCYDIYISTTEN